jgi:Zn-dependent peptidase ImmA (M78 family)/transcriptional regulator with XRE-family HTH domain
MNKQFNPDMLLLARQARGLTQAELVERLPDFTQSKLSKLESGLQKASEEDIAVFARALGFGPRFFYHRFYRRAEPPTFHRKRQKLLDSQWTQIYARAEINRICLSLMPDSVNLAPSRKPLPFCDPDEFNGKIDKIAATVRQTWLLPRGPIDDLTRAIESAGIIVATFDFGTNLIDGFSQPANENLPPLIFLNTRQPKDRLRFSLAHELGHLAMHRAPKPDMEDEANAFASALLMPEDDIQNDFYTFSIEHFAMLKLKWKCSVASIVRRARDLDILSERSYRTYNIQLSKLGWKQEEGYPITENIENPRILRQLVSAHLSQLEYTPSDLGELFGLSEEDVKEQFIQKSPQIRLAVSN